MRTVIRALLATVLVASPVYSQVADVKSGTGEVSAGGTGLPPMGFASTIASDEVYDALKRTATFSTIDKEKPGTPVVVRVSHTYAHTSAGAAVASAIFAGVTLGLLPAVSKRDLVVTYELLVNGSVLLSYSYAKNVTRIFNIHSTDRTHGLGDDGLAWVTGTAAQFAADTARDQKYTELQAEYHYYYDDPPTVTSAR
jgi:hypothetical protein